MSDDNAILPVKTAFRFMRPATIKAIIADIDLAIELRRVFPRNSPMPDLVLRLRESCTEYLAEVWPEETVTGGTDADLQPE